ncbi:MAG: PH domain-containing protein [Lachnospira sp.]|nr:PH domain-containing protein [Lachnospira sp.]MDD5829380.1 PH domain-containing protein [Lachnospira sp.]
MRLEDQLSVGEQILWRGKKAVAVSVLESIFNPFLIFALIWLLVDLSFIGMAGAFMLMGDSMGLFILGFFAIHLMPVWIYLGGVITSAIKAKNTEYMITNKGIYVRSGLFNIRVDMKPFTDLSHVSLSQGIFDRMCGTGDVISTCGHGHGAGGDIVNIYDYEKVYALVKKLQEDIYSDTMYPNDLRPEENHGYNTRYMGR